MQQNLKKALATFIRQMKSKVQTHLNLKLVLLASFLLLLLIFILRSGVSPSSSSSESTTYQNPSDKHLPCNKIPPSIAQTLIHYSTSKDVPQQTYNEVSVTAEVLARKSPCNFLVFGLGHDSLMWAALNHGGRTVFLDEDKSWIESIRQKQPSLESHHVVYNTKVSQADDLLASGRMQECLEVGEARASKCPLALKELPGVVHEIEWDLIMVDAPTGYIAEAPGRMGAIYTAGMMARARREGETDVFVHDVDRTVEDKFSKAFLCEGYLTKQEGRLRHFTIPSHRAGQDIPFCPP